MPLEGFEVGYRAADEMLNRGASPTSRELTPFDVHLYGEVAASALGIPEEIGRFHTENAVLPTLRREWINEFAQGYQARLNRYLELGAVQISQWQRATKTLVDTRIAPGLEIPGGQIKIVRGILQEQGPDDGKKVYAVFVDDRYLGEFDASSDLEAILTGFTKMRELLILLTQEER